MHCTLHNHEVMEELNIDDLINGLASVDYAEYHVVFLQMLSNIVADEESSKDETVGKKVLEFSFKRLQKSRTDNNNEEIDLVLTILSNFTVLESNSTRFFEYLDTSADDAESFKVAVHAFLQPPPATEEDPYQKMAFLLCNLSRIDLGRRLLLKQTPLCPIEHILRQINKEESIRCKGAVGCLRK